MWRRCYGYYIEGRSVHGRADTDMREMSDNLQKEQARPQHTEHCSHSQWTMCPHSRCVSESDTNFVIQEDMCGRRGLMLNSDLQTFQIALTRQFRMQYDRILTLLRTEV